MSDDDEVELGWITVRKVLSPGRPAGVDVDVEHSDDLPVPRCHRHARRRAADRLGELRGRGRRTMTAASITCPRCGRTSHNPNDVEQGYCGACHDWTSPPDGVQLFTIYDHPSDHPRHIVLRTWLALRDGRLESVGEALCDTVDEARAPLRTRGLHCLGREDHDDPTVVETWI